MVAVTMSSPIQPQRRRHPLWRLVQVLAIALAVVLLLPYLLVPLYRVVDPVSTLILWRWATGARVARSKVPLERIAPVLPATVIASEDAHFCTHHGVDWGVIRDAIEEVDDLSEARGGSTITQQLAKNLFLWAGAAICARRWNFRSRSGSTWSCPSSGSWSFTSMSPNGAQAGSSASRRARAMPLAG